MSSTEQGQSSGASNGEVSAEDAESLAAQFRPAWELDEAPFAAGSAVSPEAVNALAGADASPVVPPAPKAPSFDAAPAPAPGPANGNGNGNANGNRGMHAKTMMGMAAPQIPAAPAPVAAAVPAAIVQPIVQPMVQPAPPIVSPPEEERQLIRSERPPAIGVGVSASRGPARPAVVRPIVEAQSAANSDQYAIPRKSHLPMIIGVGAVVIALAGVGIAVKFATDTPPKPTTQADGDNKAGTRPKNDIPPPPEQTTQGPLSQDIPVMRPGSLPKAGDPSTDPPAQPAAPAAQPAQPVAQAAPKPQPIAAAPVAAPPPRGGVAAAPQPPQPPKPPKPPKGGSGGIVRDTPF